MMMQKQPLIQSGWFRAFLFALTLLVLVFLLSRAAGMLLRGRNHNLLPILLPVAVSLVAVYFFTKLMDKRSVMSLGLQFRSNEKHAWTGLFLSILLLSAGSLMLIANGNLQWTGISFDASNLFSGLILMMVTACSEELVFRGYILGNLMRSINKWWALIVSAVVFTIFHANNPGISMLAFMNVFLGGLLLGINYIYTGNLWYGILFHAVWNFYQGPVLGYHVSGAALESFLQQDLSGSPWLTGANFGFEGSVPDAVVSLIALGSLAWIYEKKSPALLLTGENKTPAQSNSPLL